MVNTLFLPELREMLANDDRSELEEFCVALNAGRTAEFMEGLNDHDVWRVLQYASPERRAEIFGYFPEIRQVAMLEQESSTQVATLVDEIPADDRVDLMQSLPEERVAEILIFYRSMHVETFRSWSLSRGTAGALMTTEVACCGPI